MNKFLFFFSLLFFVLYRLIYFYTGDFWISISVFSVPIGILLLNLVLRKSLKYKAWFLKFLRPLLDVKKTSFHSHISSDLLFEKLKEVIQDSKFKLYDENTKEHEFLCGTPINVMTWGENMYIKLTPSDDDSTSIEFISTTIFGNNSWRKNESNFKTFFNEFENALTIWVWEFV